MDTHVLFWRNHSSSYFIYYIISKAHDNQGTCIMHEMQGKHFKMLVAEKRLQQNSISVGCVPPTVKFKSTEKITYTTLYCYKI